MGRLFGTDGIRGVANEELTCQLAFRLGQAVAAVLTTGNRRRPLCLVGGDTRISSGMLSCAVSAGLCSMGADVIDLGVVPTPAVAFLIGKYKADAGIMISASHNPAAYNGIKVFSGDGYKLPDMLEERVEDLILNHEHMALVSAEQVGTVFRANDGIAAYVDHLISTVPFSPEGLHIAVDCANGSASVSAKQLFESLGAKADILFDKPDGLNINRDCGSTQTEALRRYVVEHHLDAGVAFDGDGDRCLCVDEQGNVIDGDQIMAICALDMKARGKLRKNTVVGTVMTNFGFIKFCEEQDLRFAETKVGDRFVLEEMLICGYNFGGEQSGHIIFSDFATTGDGQLTAVQLLSLLRRSGMKLSELAKVMTKYPQTTVNVPVSKEGKIAYYNNSVIRQALEEANAVMEGTGRVLVRPSGTEPLIRVMVEGQNAEKIQAVAEKLATAIRQQLS